MTALKPEMLWGLVAAAIPILIHILNRRRFRIVDFGAMRFLFDAYHQRRRRMRIEEILLLAIRTTLLALLAMAMARLFVRNPAVADTGATRQDIAVVLDASLSTSRTTGGRSPFDRGLAATAELIDTAATGDTVSVLVAATSIRALTEKPLYIAEDTKKELINRLAEQKPTASSLDLIRAFDAAGQALTAGTNPHRSIVVITDGQAHGWHADEVQRWQFLVENLKTDEHTHPAVHVLRLAAPDDTVTNLAVTDITLDRRVVGTDRPVTVTVAVTNTGTEPAPMRTVELTLDDRRIETAKMTGIGPGSVETLTLTHRFAAAGSYIFGARIAGNDDLPLDDAQSLAVEVTAALPVLVVDGDPSPDLLEAESAYLNAAFAPQDKYASVPVDYLVAATIIEAPDTLDVDLAAYRVVVLANVARLPDAFVDRLHDFVARGGGLLIAPGNRIERDYYNQTLYADGAGVLPARLDAPTGDATARERFETLSAATSDHPALRLFAPPTTIDLSKVHVYRWFPINAPTAASGLRTLASLTGGDRFAVEKRIGRGSVICTAVPWDIDWSNLPARKSYVVLTHELIYHLADPRQAKWNLDPGQALLATVDDPDAPRVGQIIDPAGNVHAVIAASDEERRTFRFDQTDQPGAYRLVLSAPTGSTTHHFAVGLDPAESDLTPLSEENAAWLTTQLEMTFLDSVDATLAAIAVDAPGREIWRWLALAVLGLLFAEVLLTRALAGRHREPLIEPYQADATKHVAVRT